MFALGLDLSLTGPALVGLDGNPHRPPFQWTTRVGELLRGPARLHELRRLIAAALESATTYFGAPIELVVMEGYGFSSQQAHSLGELGGIVKLILWELGCVCVVVPPSNLKQVVTGKGNSEKSVMLKGVYKRWGFDTDDDNVCDAYACAQIGGMLLAGELTRSDLGFLVGKVETVVPDGTTTVYGTSVPSIVDVLGKRAKKVRKKRAC